MIKNLKNWLRTSNKGNSNSENKPFLAESKERQTKRQRKAGGILTSRQVNFHDHERRGFGSEDEEGSDNDGNSEVTLTGNEIRYQHQLQRQRPVGPYSAVTAPKKHWGPRSCPGAPQLLDLDEELSSHRSEALDHSPFDTRSEFLPSAPQHRRSSRVRRSKAAIVQVQQQQRPPFRDIGNGSVVAPDRRSSVGQQHFGGGRSSLHYHNVPISMDFGRPAAAAYSDGPRLMAKLEELREAYRMERARRKEAQRELKAEREARERLQMETFRLQSIMSVLVRQQMPATSADLNTLIGAAGLGAVHSQIGGHSWTGSTPSSSNAPPPTASAVNPWPFQLAQQQHFDPLFSAVVPPAFAHYGGGHQGESLARLSSSTSLLRPLMTQSGVPIEQNHQQNKQQHPPMDDEIRVFREGRQHNSNSFSGSSRPTTGEQAELDEIKRDLAANSSRETNFSSPERGRAGGPNATFLGISFSADDFTALGRQLADTPLLKSDDGYATSETNLSSNAALVAANSAKEATTTRLQQQQHRSMSASRINQAL